MIGSQTHKRNLEESRSRLLKAIEGAPNVTFIRIYGNIGDDLIYAGARQLLSETEYTERSILHLQSLCGHTAIVSGGGAWCGTYHVLPRYLPPIERRFEKVVVFPSSFDVSINSVTEALKKSKAQVFAREEISYNQIKNICSAQIAHDTAFFFDYSPYMRKGKGILNAYREDREATGAYSLPEDNNDISGTCESLDEWLWTIARHDIVHTDRAHVMIAAALLGKRVEYRASNYHKVPAIAEFALKEFTVHRMDADNVYYPKANEANEYSSDVLSKETKPEEPLNETQLLRRTIIDIITLASPDDSFILVDDDQIRGELGKGNTAIPFLEKNGMYWGPPSDDETAIREFKRLLSNGVSFIVFAWSSFWWLEHYKEWHSYLRSNYECILENERIVVFDLRNNTRS